LKETKTFENKINQDLSNLYKYFILKEKCEIKDFSILNNQKEL
jgi:hypothetical protein